MYNRFHEKYSQIIDKNIPCSETREGTRIYRVYQ